MMGARYERQTEIVGVGSDDRHFQASSMPIYQTATFRQSLATEMGDFDYSRSGNPTRSHLGIMCYNYYNNIS